MKIKGKHFLSNQEFFDAAWQWLIVDDRPRCTNDSCCRYRYEDKTCVIGAFIPDDIFHNEMETKPIKYIIDTYLDVREWFENVDKNLMGLVQGTHDCSFGDRKEKMENIAQIFKLTIPTGEI